MNFEFSRRNLEGGEKILERVLEIVPGALAWTIIVGSVALYIVNPLAGAAFVIAFLIYWIIRLLYMNIFLVLSYAKLSIMKTVDWVEKIKELDSLAHTAAIRPDAPPRRGFRETIARTICAKQVEHLLDSGSLPSRSDEIYHLVIIPVMSETMDIVEPGIISFKDGHYPTSKMLVVIALEGRASEAVKDDCRRLVETHRACFMDCIIVVHPDGIEGEARVKGANVTYAAKRAKEYLERKSIPARNVIVSCFDADTVVSQEYFSALTYHFMVTPDRARASYQPVPVYHNNVWEAHNFARVIDVGSSFIQLIEDTDPGKRVTFSSHSMSFQALVEIGYWPVDIISDDSSIYWKALIHYEGDYRVVPIHVTLSMDVNEAGTVWGTCKNIYKQRRRWAWGAENFPIVMRAFLKKSGTPVYWRLKYAFKLFDRTINWSTWPFLYTVTAWLPIVYAPREFSSMLVYYTLPRIRGIIFMLAFTGVAACMLLSLLLLPWQKTKHGWLKKLFHVLEWIFLPPITVLLTGLPALDAQTRLMLGKYMEFWVTPKLRKAGAAPESD